MNFTANSQNTKYGFEGIIQTATGERIIRTSPVKFGTAERAKEYAAFSIALPVNQNLTNIDSFTWAQTASFELHEKTSDLSVWFYDRAKLVIGEVIEITENDFDYALGVVPPFYEKDASGRRIFGVSEMYSGNVTFWFTGERNGKYHGLLSNLQTAKDKLSKF